MSTPITLSSNVDDEGLDLNKKYEGSDDDKEEFEIPPFTQGTIKIGLSEPQTYRSFEFKPNSWDFYLCVENYSLTETKPEYIFVSIDVRDIILFEVI